MDDWIMELHRKHERGLRKAGSCERRRRRDRRHHVTLMCFVVALLIVIIAQVIAFYEMRQRGATTAEILDALD